MKYGVWTAFVLTAVIIVGSVINSRVGLPEVYSKAGQVFYPKDRTLAVSEPTEVMLASCSDFSFVLINGEAALNPSKLELLGVVDCPTYYLVEKAKLVPGDWRARFGSPTIKVLSGQIGVPPDSSSRVIVYFFLGLVSFLVWLLGVAIISERS